MRPKRKGVWNVGRGVPPSTHWLYCGLVLPPLRLRLARIPVPGRGGMDFIWAAKLRHGIATSTCHERSVSESSLSVPV